jgi:peptide/nickel transport system substrate-binding protein
MYTRPGYNPTSIKAIDKYTVEIKVRPDMQGMVGICVTGNYLWHISPDVVEMYGDMQDWKNFCGTGPFMLEDFVADSMVVMKRNPDYWQHDPIHPENQLPYLDGVKLLTISDTSSQMAALRTGKIDKLENISWDDAEQLMKQCPEMKYKEWLSDFPVELWGRMDKEELPFQDIKVRRALNMAVNKQELVDEYYDGRAELLCFPFMPLPEYKNIFTPLEEQSETVQELFEYNPEKARELLGEAGYPSGFKTEVTCSSTQSDFLSIIRAYLLDIGVDMEIKPLENSIYMATMFTRNFEEMFFSSGKLSLPFRMLETRIESPWNPSFFEHPRTRAAYEAISEAVGKDDAEVARQLKEIGPFILEQAIGVYMPSPYQYIIWWPGYRTSMVK